MSTAPVSFTPSAADGASRAEFTASATARWRVGVIVRTAALGCGLGFVSRRDGGWLLLAVPAVAGGRDLRH
jgi:hypothetical protein